MRQEIREGITIDPTNEDDRRATAAGRPRACGCLRVLSVVFVCQEEIPNSKGTANFLIKWEGAKAGSPIPKKVE